MMQRSIPPCHTICMNIHVNLRLDRKTGNNIFVPPNTAAVSQYQKTKRNSISSIIRAYKSAVTKYCRENDLAFGWQRSFYDHIIRSDQDLSAIRKYILENPGNWHYDPENIVL